MKTTPLHTALVAALVCAAPLFAQQPPMPMGGAPQVPKVELTEDSAKRAVDTYLTLREKYGDRVPAAGKTAPAGQALADAADAQSIITGNGFSDTADWQNTITNVALAYGFSKENKAGEFDAKIEELKNNTELPAGMRDQLVRTMTQLRPSDNNLKVVQSLAADSTYGAKLADISN